MNEVDTKILQELYKALEESPLIEKIAYCVLLEALQPVTSFVFPELNDENSKHQ